jgi:hypothetical protein
MVEIHSESQELYCIGVAATSRMSFSVDYQSVVMCRVNDAWQAFKTASQLF